MTFIGDVIFLVRGCGHEGPSREMLAPHPLSLDLHTNKNYFKNEQTYKIKPKHVGIRSPSQAPNVTQLNHEMHPQQTKSPQRPRPPDDQTPILLHQVMERRSLHINSHPVWRRQGILCRSRC